MRNVLIFDEAISIKKGKIFTYFVLNTILHLLQMPYSSAITKEEYPLHCNFTGEIVHRGGFTFLPLDHSTNKSLKSYFKIFCNSPSNYTQLVWRRKIKILFAKLIRNICWCLFLFSWSIFIIQKYILYTI